jgi:hypothetical protein
MGSIQRFLAHAGAAWCSVSTLALAEVPAATSEPTRAQCLANHEQAQDARLAGQLLTARAALRQCSAAACPALVSRDCVLWLTEVEQQIPSVIFRAAKDGEDVVALRVSEGDHVLTESLTGSPRELDPGPHHFVAELPGFPALDATYVLQAGDKGRVVHFDFVSPKPAAPAIEAPRAAADRPLPPEHRPIPTLTYVLGGATVTATLTGAVLGGISLAKRKDVQEDCAPLCQDRDVRGVKQLAVGADIAFALALLGGGATVYSYITRPSVPLAQAAPSSPPGARFRVVWTGWGIAAGGHF